VNTYSIAGNDACRKHSLRSAIAGPAAGFSNNLKKTLADAKTTQ